MEDDTNLISSTTVDSRESNHSQSIKHNIHAHEEKALNTCKRFKGVVGQHDSHFPKENTKFSYKEIFRKELTPTDVGKSNRLVIPMNYAKRYFPQIQDEKRYFTQIQDEEIGFYDTSGILWKFRYGYCKSRKYFFTKDWQKFVKDKGLRAKDTIVFNLCESKNGTKENSNAFMIDVVKNIEVSPIDLALNNQQQEETIDNHEVETKEFTRGQQFDHDVASSALVPVLLFGKQIGWTQTKDK